MKIASLTALALLGLTKAEEWVVTAYDGERCTSLGVETYTPLGGPYARTCRAFQNVGDTLSIIFEVPASSSQPYSLGLHKDDGCLDDGLPGGNALLSPGSSPYCLPLNGATYFSIDPADLSAPFARDLGFATVPMTTNVAVRDPGTLVARPVDQYGWFFSRAGTFVGSVNAARNQCPAFFDNAGDAILCGLYVSIAVASVVLVADELRRTFNQPAPGRRSIDSDLYAEVFGIKDGSVTSDDYIVGMTTTLTKMADSSIASRSDDDTYLHVHVQMTSHQSGDIYEAFLDFDTASDHTAISSTGDSIDPSGSRVKRQSNSVTGYYSYDSFAADARDATPPSQSLARSLGEELWNHAQGAAGYAFCANIAVASSNGLLEAGNRGYFAILNGLFNDELGDCPA